MRRGIAPDLVTDQTSAHDPLNGYVPAGLSLAEVAALRRARPGSSVIRRAKESMAVQVEAMLAMQALGSHVFDYGNNLRAGAQDAGVARRLRLPGLRPGLHPAPVLRGAGALPLGGALRRPGRHRRAPTRAVARLFPEKRGLLRWLDLAAEKVTFQGLPARICWLGYGERDRAGLAFNDLVRRGRGDGARSSSAATTSTAARWPRPTARPRR